eukprot:CAMPEP_0113399826 /NCGR_PEP_ID=MMETSP0013_2-20120614/15765_1 /TAXON_ID=2843 ORGANISM="Skeletonema costatum, Strain 1716" /NCGR_SAMPLE_ID=MMETSP0013_2 /ASSEMBLY_ACC=CAM_ASM_000158 /LENGTH=239 /DNA_ID=CAMNT_0000284791 /DNA_START=475 /DNA_END=1194 /DNA_ORIENTATION=- /assembly_acc=CAM_ASM_000158
MMLLAIMGILLTFTSFLVTVNAFSTRCTKQSYRDLSNGSISSRIWSPSSSTTLIYNTNPEIGLETSIDNQDAISYPVQIIHQGRKTTINVHENEPILQALERQSTIAGSRDQMALALSNIPHECRRGNCLTCASKNVKRTTSDNNLVVNVDNGLSPTIASELTKSGYVLTCCSYVTGPGVVLELDQNNEVWDAVYRQRLCDGDTKQVALEAQARLLRRVDEENVEKWKNKMKKVLSEEK